MAQSDWGTEVARSPAARAPDALRAAFDLLAQPPWRQKAEERLMRPGVIGDQVSLFPGAAHDLRMLVGAAANHKKCRLDALLPQQVQQPRRVHRVGPVVEGQRHLGRAFHMRTIRHQPIVGGIEEQIEHDSRSQAVEGHEDKESGPRERIEQGQRAVGRHKKTDKEIRPYHGSFFPAQAHTCRSPASRIPGRFAGRQDECTAFRRRWRRTPGTTRLNCT